MKLSPSAERGLSALFEKGLAASCARLAKLSHTQWTLQTTSIKTADTIDLKSLIAHNSSEHCGAYFAVPGGAFLALFSAESGARLADAFVPGTAFEQSALAEISNIVVSALADTLANECDISFVLPAPEIKTGGKEELLLAAPRLRSARDADWAILAYVSLISAALACDCTILILLNQAWCDRLLSVVEAQ